MSELREFWVANDLGEATVRTAALVQGLLLLRTEEVSWFECDFEWSWISTWPSVAVEAAERLVSESRDRPRGGGYQQVRVEGSFTGQTWADFAALAPHTISGLVWSHGDGWLADFSDLTDVVSFKLDADQVQRLRQAVVGIDLRSSVPDRPLWARLIRKTSLGARIGW